MKKLKSTVLLISTIGFIASCSVIVPMFTAEKEMSSFKDTKEEKSAHHYFWNKLHQGQYDSVDIALNKLHNVYQKDPNDFKIAAHLGFAYAWKVTERRRIDNLEPKIAASADLAQEYFSKAVELNPNDPRLWGFKSGFMLANGSRHNNSKLRRKGYFLGKKSIRMWPSFNFFSVGYVMSVVDHQSTLYDEAVEFQWKNLEECLCRDIDRNDPKLQDIHKMPEIVKDDYKKSRACVNSWIAPHNVEGFLLNLGDMLVKKGDTSQALVVYNSIRQVEEFNEWPYKHVLKKRINNMHENVMNFRRPTQTNKDNKQVFISTTFACTACHQKSKTEFEKQNMSIPLNEKTYFLKSGE